MFKTKNIYSLRERAVSDIKKGSKTDWSLIGIIWLAIIITFLTGIGDKTQASDTLSFNLQPPKTYDWELPKNVLVGNYNEYQNYWMNYAWNRWHDKEFMYLLKAENGLFNHDRRHDPSGNAVGVDWGFCGTNDYHHAEKVNDPRFFSDPAWQLEKCYEMYKDGVTFYGLIRVRNEPDYRYKISKHFNL